MLDDIHRALVGAFGCKRVHFGLDCCFGGDIRQFFEPYIGVKTKLFTEIESDAFDFGFDRLIKSVDHLSAEFVFVLAVEFVEVERFRFLIVEFEEVLILFVFIFGAVVVIFFVVDDLRHAGTVLDEFLNFLVTELAVTDILLT